MSECAWKQQHKIVVGPITLPDCMSGMYLCGIIYYGTYIAYSWWMGSMTPIMIMRTTRLDSLTSLHDEDSHIIDTDTN